MKVKFIFSFIQYLGLSTVFFRSFLNFLFFPPLVNIYRHLLLSNTKINYVSSVRKQTHCMDYGQTSPQQPPRGQKIVPVTGRQRVIRNGFREIEDIRWPRGDTSKISQVLFKKSFTSEDSEQVKYFSTQEEKFSPSDHAMFCLLYVQVINHMISSAIWNK